jgi:hypothetical protein
MIKRSNNLNIYVVKRVKEMEIPNKTSVIDFQVRWNTTYDMLDRFFVFKRIIDEITSNPGVVQGLDEKKKNDLRNLDLSLDDWRIVQFLIKILKPFKRVTDILQGQKYETIALSKAAELILFRYYEKFESTNPKELIVAEKIMDIIS